jgi:type IX secretion system PorP/SprF family membrane protein
MLRTSKLIISLFVLIGCLSGTQIHSQDAHFSQFYAAPLLLNPALSGSYNGTFRISTVYRDQWYSATDNSLRTFSASGDAKFKLGNNLKGNNDIVSVGINFFSDRIATFDLNTNEILLTTAFHKSLNKKKNQYLGIGIQGGIFQKEINYEDLLFGDQFNAIDGYDLQTLENLPTNSRGYFDLSTGVYYSSAPSRDFNYHLGVGVFHLTQPNLSFYNDINVIDPNINKGDTLFRKFSFHTGATFQRGERLSFQPRINVLTQEKHFEANVGTQFRYKINPQAGQYLTFGLYARGVKNFDNYGLESLIGLVGYERNNFLVGISYDQAITQLIRDRRSLPSLEISIIYIGEYHNDDNFCPQF